MPSDTFNFKRFSIRHDRCAMRVGTDGVLLGAWSAADLEIPPTRILDVGTGSGLIALMLAQRFPTAGVEGIDIHAPSLSQAVENVAASPFASRVIMREDDFSHVQLLSHSYHLIVSNPPFHTEQTLGGNASRDAARHASSLPFETLIERAAEFLHPEGRLSLVVPHHSASLLIGLCALHGLHTTRHTLVCSTPSKAPIRSLLEFARTIRPTNLQTLVLYDTQGHRTPQYDSLTRDFYL